MSNDILFNVANEYLKLIDYSYEFQVKLNNHIHSFKLEFTESEFKHLSGIEKLTDLLIHNLSSETILNNILNLKITYSDLSKSRYIDVALNDNSPNNISYHVIDRLKELGNLPLYLQNMDKHNISVFQWKRNELALKRPNGSKIVADLLISFSGSNYKKIDSEQTCSFFIETNSLGIFNGVSIFPTDISYSNDGKIKLSEYKILSATEICKSTGKITPLIQCSPEELRKAQEASLRKDQSITIKNDLKALKSKRNDYVSNLDIKTRTAYKKRLSIFQNRNIYTPEMLDIVADRLKAQLDDPHNCAVSETIKSEIEYIKNEAELRCKEPDRPTEKSISIVKNQLNADGTISSETAAEIPIPNVKKISQKSQRDTHTVVGSINSLISDVKDFFNALKKPKKQTPVKKKTPPCKPKNSVKTVDKSVSQQRKKSIEISKKVQKTTPEKSAQNTPEKPVDKPYMSIEIIKEEARRIREERIKNPGPKKEKSHSHEIE